MPIKSHAQRSLVGYSPWGCTELGIEEKGEGGHRRDLEEKMEKAMAPHSSTLAWKIPCTEEPGGPWSMGSLRVGHD